jgi:AhpD family alkylhydroperoxidase
MEPRLSYGKLAPEAMRAMNALDGASGTSIDPKLLDLIKLRASQINGCGYCVDMHTKDGREKGETEQRLHAVTVWHESPFFTEQEKAALAWTEAVTMISDGHAPDDVCELAREHFSDKELVDLTFAVVAINAWNRLAVSFRSVPGTYRPDLAK